MEITINRTYEVEGDHHDGDLLLLNKDADVRIIGGYTELRQAAIDEVGRYEQGHDGEELEYSDEEVNRHVADHIEDYIRHCFMEGKISKA